MNSSVQPSGLGTVRARYMKYARNRTLNENIVYSMTGHHVDDTISSCVLMIMKMIVLAYRLPYHEVLKYAEFAIGYGMMTTYYMTFDVSNFHLLVVNLKCMMYDVATRCLHGSTQTSDLSSDDESDQTSGLGSCDEGCTSYDILNEGDREAIRPHTITLHNVHGIEYTQDEKGLHLMSKMSHLSWWTQEIFNMWIMIQKDKMIMKNMKFMCKYAIPYELHLMIVEFYV